MIKTNLMDKYPISILEVPKDSTTFNSVDEILAHLKSKIDIHPVATFIAIFDHYTHTLNLADGELSDDILDAKNIICCFGKQLPNPTLMSVRPRAIGVAEMSDKFVVSFMDAPNPQAQDAMILWVKSIINS